MKRGIKCIILICMIAIIGGCSSNNKKNNTNSDLEEQSKINIDDIDWKIKQVKVGEMIYVVYFDKCQYVYKKGIISRIDLEHKKEITIVDTKIPVKNILMIG